MALQDKLDTMGASFAGRAPPHIITAMTFPVLIDKGNETAAAFGLRFGLPDELIAMCKGFGNDLAAVNGEPSWTLPMPGRFVVAPDGVIAYAEINPDYTRRPDPADMMPALRQAAGQRANRAYQNAS